MAGTTTMTVRLPVDVVEKLDGLARSTERTRSFLAGKAIEEYVAVQEWQVQAIEDAVRKADSPRARFHDHDAVAAAMRKKTAVARRGRAR